MKTQSISFSFPFPRQPRFLLFLLFAMMLPVRFAMAQYRAGLQGTVTDPTGAVVPGASVTIVDKETNQTQKVTTDGGGTFTVNRLAPAPYTVTVEATGFATKTVDNVNISGETMQALNVALDAAGSSQSVTVTDTAPAINTSNANISGVITGQQLQVLPSSNRDPYQLLRLSPGALGDGSQQGGGGTFSLPGNGGIGGSSASGAQGSIFAVENRAQTQSNGVRTSGNSFQIDGSQVNSLAWGGGAVITPNQESVKEIQNQTSPYDATNGRNSGSQVLIVSKNGTNEFHGSAFFKFHRPGLNAYQRWNGPGSTDPGIDHTKTLLRDNNQFNQLGGSIGGPIWKNHVFFFFSYEELRSSGSVNQAPHWYETPEFDQLVAQRKQGGVSAAIVGYPGESVTRATVNPSSNCAFASLPAAYCHTVPYNGGTALDLGSPLTTPLGTADPSYISNGSPGIGGGFDGVPDLFYANTVNPTTSTAQQFNGRLDWQLNPRDLIAYTIYWVPTSQTSFNGPNRAANLWNTNRLAYSHAALWNHIFTPTLLNEFRLNAVRWYFNEVASNPQEPFGLPQGRIDTLGGINDFQYFGAPGPGNFAQTTYNLRDTMTKTWRSHNIRFGFDGYRELDNDTQSGQAIPSYTFRNLWEFANDKPRLLNGIFDPRTGTPTTATKYIRSYIYAGYIQDDWRVTPKLTLNLGLRYEYFGPTTEKNGNISNPVLGTGAQTLTGLTMKVGGDLYKTSPNNWGPQFGFAYSINPSSNHLAVVRGGFGIAYNRMQQAVTLNGRSNPPLVTNVNAVCLDTSLNNCPGVQYSASSSPTDISGYPVNPAAIATFGSNGLPVGGAPLSIQAIQQDLPTPLTYKTSLGVEYALASQWVLSLGYQGSISRHYTRQTNLNWIYYPNLNPSISSLSYFVNDTSASSHAFLAEVRHNMGHSFSITGQYRWGKIMDTASNDYYIDQYPFDNRYAYSPADYDITHNAKLFGTYAPKFFPGNRLLEGIFGGIQISGIMQYHTGFPWTPVYSNTGCNVVFVGSGYCTLRPGAQLARGTGDTSNDTFKSPGGQFPNGGLAYYTVPTIPTTGTPPPPGVGRNSLRGPNYFDTDMDAQKTFGLPKTGIFGESAGLTIRAMFFNIFNQTNITPFNSGNTNNAGDANTLIDSSNFGRGLTALGSRTIEFQARFAF